MSTLLTIAISILVLGVILLVVLFPLLRRSSHQHVDYVVTNPAHREAFLTGLTHVDIQQPELRRLVQSLQNHIVGMDDFLH